MQPAAAKSGRWKWVAAAAGLLPALALAVAEITGATHFLRKPQTIVAVDPKVDPAVTPESGPNAGAKTPPAVAPRATEWAREIAPCAGHKGPARGVAFGPGGKFLASGGADQSVRIWDPNDGKQLRSFEFRGRDVGAVAVAGDLLLAGGRDYAFTGWDTNTWQETFAVTDHPGWSARALAPHRSGFLSCGPNDGGFHFFDFKGKFTGGWFTSDGSKPGSVSIRPDGRRIVVALVSGAIDFWIDPQSKPNETKRKVLPGHSGAVRALAYSSTGATLASAGIDKSIKLWDGEDGKELATLAGHDGAVLALAFSPDGKFLASGGADRTIRLWDVTARKPVGAALTLPATVNALAWSPDGHTLASACEDGSVTLWYVTPQPRSDAPTPVAAAPFTDTDVNRIAALPAEQQVEEVRKELMRRNPGFDGKVEHKIEDGVVTEFSIVTDTVTDIAPIRVFDALRVLKCSGTHIDKPNGPLADLTPLEGMNLAGLTHLDLKDTNVADAGLVYFKDCKHLGHLDLSHTKVTDRGLAHFKDCKALTSLYLTGTEVSDAGLAHLEGCKNLTSLGLVYTRVSDAGLIHFKDCKALTQLYLGGTNVSDVGLTHFKESKNLIHLNLDHTQASDAGLAYFKDCKNLTFLSLGHTRVSDVGLIHFKDCKALTSLFLYGTNVSDAGLTELKGTPLKELWIYNTDITDLAPLQGMPLEAIRLTPKNITRGLDILRDVKSLKTIGIEWNQAWPAAEFWERYDKGEFKE